MNGKIAPVWRLRYRAIFGLGYLLLGALALWRLAAAPGVPQAKILGALVCAAMIALGAWRIGEYLRARGR